MRIRVGRGHKVAGGAKAQLGSLRTGRSHSLSGTCSLTLQIRLKGHPWHQSCCSRDGVEMCATGKQAQHMPGQAIGVSWVHPYHCVALIMPSSQQEGEHMPKRIIQWLLGKKIVNMLVSFTKPQPKKVTHKIPERKWCSRLWLQLPIRGWELWPTGHSRDGGGRDIMRPDHCPQTGRSQPELWARH